jgi:hypothetical protein
MQYRISIEKKGERLFLASTKTVRWVDEDKGYRKWHRASAAEKVLGWLEEQGVTGARVEGMTNREVLQELRDKDDRREEEEREKELAEDILFDKLNEVCLSCTEECKQSHIATIMYCPDYKKAQA